MTRGDGFDRLLKHLAELGDAAAPAAAQAMKPGAAALEATAKSSSGYEDQTGATRAATTAYVMGGGLDESGAVTAAADVVADKNPGKSFVTDGDEIGPDEVAVILTVPTIYDEDLETKKSGAYAHLGPALTQARPQLDQAAALGLKKLITRTK